MFSISIAVIQEAPLQKQSTISSLWFSPTTTSTYGRWRTWPTQSLCNLRCPCRSWSKWWVGLWKKVSLSASAEIYAPLNKSVGTNINCCRIVVICLLVCLLVSNRAFRRPYLQRLGVSGMIWKILGLRDSIIIFLFQATIYLTNYYVSYLLAFCWLCWWWLLDVSHIWSCRKIKNAQLISFSHTLWNNFVPYPFSMSSRVLCLTWKAKNNNIGLLSIFTQNSPTSTKLWSYSPRFANNSYTDTTRWSWLNE